MAASFDQQHRHVGPVQHLLRDGSGQEPAHRVAPAGPHHDQIDVPLLCACRNDVGGSPKSTNAV